MDPTGSTEGATAESASRQRVRLIAAIMVLLLAAVGVAAALLRGGPEDDPINQPAPGASTAAPPGALPGCAAGVAPPSNGLPTAAPEDLQLAIENRAVIPVSDRYGPAVRTGPTWTCFSHSPLGAVMAAQSISTRRVASPQRVKVGEQQLVENAGRDLYLRAVRASKPEDVTAAPGTFTQPAGFNIVTYTPQTAVVLLASRSSKSGQLLSGTVTVVWVDGTWKLQLLPDGSDTPALTPLTSLTGYITWGL